MQYKSWKCISKSECSKRQLSGFTLTNMLNTADDAETYYKVHGEQCVEKCPNLYQPKRVRDRQTGDLIWACKKCKKDCPVNCDGEIINSQESAKKLESCTNIKGDIVINVMSGDITPVLEQTLKHIKSISGSLKIERSHSLVSLHFFKSLRWIGGETSTTSQKALTIFENDNLQKLFPDNNKVELGNKMVFIHYNQKLCMKEITGLLDLAAVPAQNREEHFISSVSNGNKIVCSEEKLELSVRTGGSDLLRLQYQNYMHHLQSLNEIDVSALLGYHIYYRELTEEQFITRDITKYEGMDACSGSAWNVLFEDDLSRFTTVVDSTGENATCDDSTEQCMYLQGKLIAKYQYNPVVTYIPSCKPYTPYAIYVTTVMEKQLAGKATGAQSDISYARTNESNPSPVVGLKADSPTPHTLELSWQPPALPHGIIQQYYVEVSYLGIGRDVEERDYCRKGKKDKVSEVVPDPAAPSKEEQPGTCPVCQSCGLAPDQNSGAHKTVPESGKVVGEMAFYNEIINKLFHIQTTTAAVVEGDPMFQSLISRRRRSVSSSAGPANSLSSPADKESEDYVYIQYQRNGPIKKISVENETLVVGGGLGRGGQQYSKRVFLSLPGTQLATTITNLKHYSDYEVRVFACQKQQQEGSSGRQFRVCSDESILNTKTTFLQDADTIPAWPGESAQISSHTGNTSEVTFIRWLAPPNPNERILNYILSRSQDINTEKPFTKCISLADIQVVNITVDGMERTALEYRLHQEGEYYVRLRAVSLYQEGSETTYTVRTQPFGLNL